MRDWMNEAGGGARHRRRRSAARITTIIVVTVLSVLAIGYVRSAAHQQTAPPRPAGPGATAGDSPFTAEAAAAVARLQAKVGDAYTATHLWQAASALSATIGFMHATGSQAYLGDLNATYHAHHRGDTFRDNYYDDEGWWALTWIRAYGLTDHRAYLRQAKSVFAALTKGWTPACGGGLQWAHRRPYKNAITNETFMADAALLHEATPGDTRYARWPYGSGDGSPTAGCSPAPTWSSMACRRAAGPSCTHRPGPTTRACSSAPWCPWPR